MKSEIDRLREENAELRKALEPFARADRAIGNEEGPFRFETATGFRLIRREDFRAAGSALAGDKQKQTNQKKPLKVVEQLIWAAEKMAKVCETNAARAARNGLIGASDIAKEETAKASWHDAKEKALHLFSQDQEGGG